MTKPRYNYKVSCVGVNEKGYESRLVFFVFEVKTLEDARRAIRKDTFRRKIMKQSNIDWRTVELRAVKCNKKGNVTEANLIIEIVIMSLETEEINYLHRLARTQKYAHLNGEQHD